MCFLSVTAFGSYTYQHLIFHACMASAVSTFTKPYFLLYIKLKPSIFMSKRLTVSILLTVSTFQDQVICK